MHCYTSIFFRFFNENCVRYKKNCFSNVASGCKYAIVAFKGLKDQNQPEKIPLKKFKKKMKFVTIRKTITVIVQLHNRLTVFVTLSKDDGHCT